MARVGGYWYGELKYVNRHIWCFLMLFYIKDSGSLGLGVDQECINLFYLCTSSSLFYFLSIDRYWFLLSCRHWEVKWHEKGEAQVWEDRRTGNNRTWDREDTEVILGQVDDRGHLDISGWWTALLHSVTRNRWSLFAKYSLDVEYFILLKVSIKKHLRK